MKIDTVQKKVAIGLTALTTLAALYIVLIHGTKAEKKELLPTTDTIEKIENDPEFDEFLVLQKQINAMILVLSTKEGKAFVSTSWLNHLAGVLTGTKKLVQTKVLYYLSETQKYLGNQKYKNYFASINSVIAKIYEYATNTDLGGSWGIKVAGIPTPTKNEMENSETEAKKENESQYTLFMNMVNKCINFVCGNFGSSLRRKRRKSRKSKKSRSRRRNSRRKSKVL